MLRCAQGFVLVKHGRMTDAETAALKKEFITYSSQTEPHREAPGPSGGRGREEAMARAFTVASTGRRG